MMNKTKTIVTIGPASKDKETIKKLILNGADILRLNLTYADHEFCEEIIKKVNECNKELNKFTSIMLDTKGPTIKAGRFVDDHAYLTKGDKVRIYANEVVGDNTKFSVSYEDLINDVRTGTIIKLSNGNIELQVLEKLDDAIICEVIKEGIVSSYSRINIPGIKINMPFLSDEDKEDINFACKMNVDYLALSFVSTIEDVLEVNDLLIELENDHIGIISKIENDSAVVNLDEIINVSEGILVDRGTLGVEVPLERVPGIQKNIISKCHMQGKVSVVATEMISSMENSLTPTRAEVSDIANAVLDGCDAVILSNETTIGKYPIETLEMMEKVIKAAEADLDYMNLMDIAVRTEKQDITGILSHSVIDSAYRLRAQAIIAPTVSGYTARKMSRFRPSCNILAVSPNIDTVKSLNIYYGVTPCLIKELDSIDKIIKESKKIAINILELKEKDKIIITGGYPFKEVKHTNFMKIEEL